MSCKVSCRQIVIEPPPFFNLTQLSPLLLPGDEDDFLMPKSKCYNQVKYKSALDSTSPEQHQQQQQTTYLYLIVVLIVAIILLVFLIALIVGVYLIKLNRTNVNLYKASTISSLSHDSSSSTSHQPSADRKTATTNTSFMSMSSLITPMAAINKSQPSQNYYDSIRENTSEFYYSYERPDPLPSFNIIYNPYINGHIV
jgi:hypothetical protein